MARLYGREWTRAELLQHVGDIQQVGGVRQVTLAEGREQGVRAAEFRTGTGFQFTVLIDRGLDIAAAEYCGRSLAWRSMTGEAHPAYYEPEGLGWLRTFYGGLLVTVALACLLAGGPGYALTFRTYEDAALGISLSVPEEWETRRDRDGTVTINGSTGVLVVSARPRGRCTPETLREHAALYVLNENTRVTNSGRKTLNGVPGWLFQYRTTNASDPLRGDTFCTLHENYLLVIAFVTRDWLYKATRPVFERCLQSIQLSTPPGLRPLAPGYRRYEDREHRFRLQIPENWAQQGDARMPSFTGDSGTLQIFTDASARYLPGDAEILARAYVDKANYKLKTLARGKLDGHPAHFAFCTLPDRPDWAGCFIVLIRAEKLYVLKMAHDVEQRKTLLDDVVRSFEFEKDAAPAAPQVSQAGPAPQAAP